MFYKKLLIVRMFKKILVEIVFMHAESIIDS